LRNPDDAFGFASIARWRLPHRPWTITINYETVVVVGDTLSLSGFWNATGLSG
jgi:hypothetical protein